MIESMTGYGKADLSVSNKKITVEIKSINSKQLDLTLRVPALYRDQETQLRNLISPIIERGKVDVTLTVENMIPTSALKINQELLKDYKKQIEELTEALELDTPQDWINILFRLPDAWTTKMPEADEEDANLIRTVCEEACQNLRKSRIQEGEKLYYFFFEKTAAIKNLLEKTSLYESSRVPKIRERLEQQLQKLESIEYDRGRLEQELIFYIEKLDVTEEKIRLNSHILYFEETLGEPNDPMTGGKGKKLGFIAQEMGREINTLGSKSNDAEMQRIVVMMKDELEQIKEQVLNVL